MSKIYCAPALTVIVLDALVITMYSLVSAAAFQRNSSELVVVLQLAIREQGNLPVQR
jgi:hypothetical protein